MKLLSRPIQRQNVIRMYCNNNCFANWIFSPIIATLMVTTLTGS